MVVTVNKKSVEMKISGTDKTVKVLCDEYTHQYIGFKIRKFAEGCIINPYVSTVKSLLDNVITGNLGATIRVPVVKRTAPRRNPTHESVIKNLAFGEKHFVYQVSDERWFEYYKNVKDLSPKISIVRNITDIPAEVLKKEEEFFISSYKIVEVERTISEFLDDLYSDYIRNNGFYNGRLSVDKNTEFRANLNSGVSAFNTKRETKRHFINLKKDLSSKFPYQLIRWIPRNKANLIHELNRLLTIRLKHFKKTQIKYVKFPIFECSFSRTMCMDSPDDFTAQGFDGKISGKYKDKFQTCGRPSCGKLTHRDHIKNFVNLETGISENWCNNCYMTHAPRIQEVMQRYTASPIEYFKGKGLNDNDIFKCTKEEKLKFKDKKKLQEYKRTTLFYGVELEVKPSNLILNKSYGNWRHEQVAAYYVDRLMNKELKSAIMKPDGSCPGGFEIVSVPGTHLWHTTEAWEKFFDKKDGVSKYLSGWDHKDCGMHVHVSRAALSPIQIGRMLVFINNKENLPFVEKVAGRSQNRYTQFHEKKIKDAYYAGPDRYQAINISTGKGTVEFRIFRSNTAKHGFLKNIDFVAALCCWSKEVSNLKLNTTEFIKWVDERRGEYKYLSIWMVKHKYLKEIHKDTAKHKRVFEMEA